MAQLPIKIWSNAKIRPDLAARLQQDITPHTFVWVGPWADPLPENASGFRYPDADVIYGQPKPESLASVKPLRWVHLDTAGYTQYEAERRSLQSREVIVTNSSSVFAQPCAEAVLAFMLCQARMLAPLIVNDATRSGWPHRETRDGTHLLRRQSALLVGFGAIARRLMQLLAPFEMRISAVRRSVRGDESIRTFASHQIDEALADVDHVINLLPAAQGTAAIFNASRFSQMKRGVIFYNIGRGDTVDQEALCDALEAGQVAAAYLDVTTPEPLPPGHRLWKVPNCWITPHVAGGHEIEMEMNMEHFVENFSRFVRGEKLRDRVI